LTKRIEAIASYIKSSDKIADIGCDSAELSIYLAHNKISSIAIDINTNIIENDKLIIHGKNLNKYIDLRVGNGTEVLKLKEVNTLVLAGLGSYTIIKIIEHSKYKYKKIITIANKNHKFLRKKMLEYNYKILSEEIIIEKNKYYNLIVFVPGKVLYSNEDLAIGINHKNKENLLKYHHYIKTSYDKYSNFNKNENIKELVDIIKNYKY
jgi:tRNA (adenine22-N1)-methyltransferase